MLQLIFNVFLKMKLEFVIILTVTDDEIITIGMSFHKFWNLVH